MEAEVENGRIYASALQVHGGGATGIEDVAAIMLC